MNKLIAAVLSFLIFFNFFGCAALRVKFAEKAGLELMQAAMANPVYEENGELLTCQYELRWKGREYEAFGIAETEHIGKLFGLTDMASHMRVFLVADQSPDDWLIWVFGDFMGVWLLCKEKSATDIPDGFVPFGTE
ncbi:MAG: hypothetical protein FWE98_07485 [Oscillospiraceae bacterium]|nr:hypothetical protein [Oscillospiraceae bacterium]